MQLIFRVSTILAALGLVWPAQSASFDCSKAKAPDEISICKTPELSELDSEMGSLWFAYRSIPMLMGASGARTDEAQKFLHDRAACGSNVPCLTHTYQTRIAVLKQDVTQAMKNIAQEENQPAPQANATQQAALPAPVEKAIEEYTGQCQKLGGTLTGGMNRANIMSADFDGDGKSDYVLNPQYLRCSAAATAFCGNGGCQLQVFVSGNGYQKPISVMGGAPTISQTEEGTNVEIWVSRSQCTIAPQENKACWAIYSWKNGKLAETFQVRAIPGQ